MTAEFWQVASGDTIEAPFWPFPVRVEAAEALSARFTRVRWTAPGASGVSRVSEHALIRFADRWGDDTGRRYVPREVPAADAAADSVRAQRLAGIAGVIDHSRFVAEWAVESDLAALGRGKNLQPQQCGCFR